MYLFELAIMAFKGSEGWEYILLLEVIVQGRELLGRRQQLGSNLRVGLLGLVQLLFEVKAFPVDFQDFSGSHPIDVILVKVICSLDCAIDIAKCRRFAVLELENDALFDA
jgi:hypothetical protein